MAPNERELATKPDNLSSIPSNKMVEGENWLPQTVPRFPAVLNGTHIHIFLKEILMTVQTMVYSVGEHVRAVNICEETWLDWKAPGFEASLTFSYIIGQEAVPA